MIAVAWGGLVRCSDCRGSNRWGRRSRQVTRPCATCGVSVARCEAVAAANKRAFCNYECKAEWMRRHHRGPRHPLWTGGEAAKRARVEADPVKRLRRRISNGIWWSLRGDKRGRRWETLVGYTLDDLKRHIERQFSKGMTWENYGAWHIDHVMPVSAFRITGPDCAELRACWRLSNLRPLWGKENISKGAKVLTLL